MCWVFGIVCAFRGWRCQGSCFPGKSKFYKSKFTPPPPPYPLKKILKNAKIGLGSRRIYGTQLKLSMRLHMCTLNRSTCSFCSGYRHYYWVHTICIIHNFNTLCFVQSRFIGHQNDTHMLNLIRQKDQNQGLPFPNMDLSLETQWRIENRIE